MEIAALLDKDIKADRPPARAEAEGERPGPGRQSVATERDRSPRRELVRYLGRRGRPEVATPTGHVSNRLGGETEDGDAGDELRAGDAAALPRRGSRVYLGTERAQRGRCRHVSYRDQPRGILASDEVCPDRECGLFALASNQCCAVTLSEDREACREDEERDRDDGVAGIPRKRDRGEPERNRLPCGCPRGRTKQPRKQARYGGDGGDRDQRRKQQEHGAGAFLTHERVRVSCAARECDCNRHQGPDSGNVEGRE